MSESSEFGSFEVVGRRKHVPESEAPASVASVMRWLSGNAGWMVECNWSRTHHAPEYRAADSKRRPGQEQPDHRKGELKAPEHDRDHWFLGAALVGNQQMIARFVGWWTRKDSDSSPTFNSASCWDRITSEQFVEKQWEPVKRWLRILAPNGAPAVRKTKQEKLEEQGLWDGRS